VDRIGRDQGGHFQQGLARDVHPQRLDLRGEVRLGDRLEMATGDLATLALTRTGLAVAIEMVWNESGF
jgi:hypothetical protein